MEQWLSDSLTALSGETAVRLGASTLKSVTILVVALVASILLRRFGSKLTKIFELRINDRTEQEASELSKRANTLSAILITTAKVLVWGIALMMLLAELGFNLGPVLTGAGIVGVAVGFGAQNVVKDVIAGGLMLLENQVRVGDVAIINGTGGLVERINLRTTVLRSLDGTVHVFPNGSVATLSNMTYEYSYYLINMGVAYKENTDHVVACMEEVVEDMRTEESFGKDILDPLEVLGVDGFGDSAVTIKARIKTHPLEQWRIGREFNRRIKKRFDQEGIEIPFPHRSIYFGEASKPFALELNQQAGRGQQLSS